MCSGAQELASDGSMQPPAGYTWTSVESFSDAGSPAVLRESEAEEPEHEPEACCAHDHTANGATGAAISSVQVGAEGEFTSRSRVIRSKRLSV